MPLKIEPAFLVGVPPRLLVATRVPEVFEFMSRVAMCGDERVPLPLLRLGRLLLISSDTEHQRVKARRTAVETVGKNVNRYNRPFAFAIGPPRVRFAIRRR